MSSQREGNVPSGERRTVAFLPSVSGGLGHVTRTLRLAQALERADPSLQIIYVLGELNLRRFTEEAVRQTGYPVRILPNPNQEQREVAIRSAMSDVDVVIEDTERRMVAYRRLLPRLKVWVSIPMLPLWDELFMDWPYLEQADHILYTYPSVMPLPPELRMFGEKVTETGPLLDEQSLPDRVEARRRVGLGDGERLITYAPRGFPFGEEFGRRVLDGVLGAFAALRQREPGLRLVLTAVPDIPAARTADWPPLNEIEGVTVEGIIAAEKVRDYLAAADLVVVEGYSTLVDAAALRTPVLMVPGTIYESWLEGTWLTAHDAGVVVWIEQVTRERMTEAMNDALGPAAPARAERLINLVGLGGCDRAVATVRRLIAERVGP